MNNSLEEKRREIFELHQSWLRPDTELMRKPAPVKQTPILKEDLTEKPAISSRKWIVKLAIAFAVVFILLELLFFAYELGWF